MITQALWLAAFILTGGVAQTSTSLEGTSAADLNGFTEILNKYIFLERSSPLQTLIWSPLSVYSMLVPLEAGAGGKTFEELYLILHSSSMRRRDLDGDTDDDDGMLFGHTKSKVDEPGTGGGLQSATGLFISKDFKLRRDFVTKLKNEGGRSLIDKMTFEYFGINDSSAQVAAKVNSWLNSTTGGLIPEILQPQSVDPQTKMIVVNGVQFKGTWKTKFDESATFEKVFNGLNGPTKVKMMTQTSTKDYGLFHTDSGERYEVLKLGYDQSIFNTDAAEKGKKVSQGSTSAVGTGMKLVLILPEDPSTIRSVLKSLAGPGRMATIMEQLEPTKLDIFIPKLKLESFVPVKQVLVKAGLETLFSRMDANLTRMIELRKKGLPTTDPSSVRLYLNDILHKTVFELDEDGTKAGAATAGLLIPLMNTQRRTFTLDRPFILMLRDTNSNIIFQGVIADLPEASSIKPTADTSPTLPSTDSAPPTDKTDPGQGASNQNEVPVPKGTSVNTPRLNIEPSGNSSTNPDNSDPNNLIKLQSNETSSAVQDPSNPSSSLQTSKAMDTSFRFQQPEPTDPEAILFLNSNRFKTSPSSFQTISQDLPKSSSSSSLHSSEETTSVAKTPRFQQPEPTYPEGIRFLNPRNQQTHPSSHFNKSQNII